MGNGNVPFSWEDMPGISKSKGEAGKKPYAGYKLPPPPCPQSHIRKIPSHEMQNIPLPPCAFQPPPLPPPPPQRNLSNKGMKKAGDDPFLVAYRKCTTSTKEARKSLNDRHSGAAGSGLRKHMSGLSCKRSCSVRDDNLIRISHSDS